MYTVLKYTVPGYEGTSTYSCELTGQGGLILHGNEHMFFLLFELAELAAAVILLLSTVLFELTSHWLCVVT